MNESVLNRCSMLTLLAISAFAYFQGDIHKALLLGKLLSVTRSQIYADADEDSPSHDLYDARPAKAARTDTTDPRRSHTKNVAESTGPLRHGELDANGMHGQGAPAGGAESGVGRMASQDVVRAKL